MLSFACYFIAAGAAALLATSPVFSDALPARLRGTITAIDDEGITLNERSGRSFRLATGSGTTYADVVPSSLKEIRVSDYIGSAVKGPRNHSDCCRDRVGPRGNATRAYRLLRVGSSPGHLGYRGFRHNRNKDDRTAWFPQYGRPRLR